MLASIKTNESARFSLVTDINESRNRIKIFGNLSSMIYALLLYLTSYKETRILWMLYRPLFFIIIFIRSWHYFGNSFDSWCRFLQNCESSLRSQQKDFYIWNNYIVQSIWNTFSVSELQLSTYILLYGSRSWYSIEIVQLQLSSNRQ